MAIDPSTAFVSYSRDDWEFVLRVAKDLKAKGAKVWMDKLDIRPGQRWEREVETALNNCSRMLVILSPASVGSSNVLAEAAFAIDEGKEVIPVLYLECKIPFRLRPFQYADFRTTYEEGLQELLATLDSDRATAEAAAAAPALTTTPAAALVERERKAAEDKERQEELERQREAAEQARLEEERKQAAAEKARLEQGERRVMIFGRGIQDLVRSLRGHSAPLIIAGIVGAILIVGWLIYRRSSSSRTTPIEVREPLLILSRHQSAVKGVAYSPDGKRLATASMDKTAKVWDAVSGQELLTLRGHLARYAVSGVAFSPDGKCLATASWDNTVKVWDAVSGQALLELSGWDPLNVVAYSPDGKRLAAAVERGTAEVWDAVSR